MSVYVSVQGGSWERHPHHPSYNCLFYMYTDGWIEFSQTDVGDSQLESV